MKSNSNILILGLLSVLYIFQTNVVKATKHSEYTLLESSIPPVAQNDTFIHIAQNLLTLTGNVLLNDYDPNGDEISIYFAESPKEAYLKMQADGNFVLQLPPRFSGIIEFEYYIKELTEDEYTALAHVFVQIIENSDLDMVEDAVDLDNDNDGLPDSMEGIGIDTDNDGIPNNYDIDSDNDGIPDNTEWQDEFNYVEPLYVDANNNGWDDAYDTEMGGTCYSPVDTDEDGIPDMLDRDSDSDGKNDLAEAFDFNEDGRADIQLLFSDMDEDGLDDAFDCVVKGRDWQNSIASTCSLVDLNQDGVRDWRDFTSHFNYSSAYIYPNPAVRSFQVFHPKQKYNQQLIIQIRDIQGQVKKIYKTAHSNDYIPVQDLINGSYIVTVTTDDFTYSQQVVIQH